MTIREVAKRAQVSIATVSRTLNNPACVSEETAARVLKAVEELNYLPSTQARFLVLGVSRILGLIVSDITNPFFPEIVREFEEAGSQRDFTVLVSSTSYRPERMALAVKRMLEYKAQGVAIMTSEMDPTLVRQFAQRRVPLVFLDVGQAGPGVSNLRVDYRRGITQAVAHLIGLNHRTIAFISGPLTLKSARVRREAFLETLHSHEAVTGQRAVIDGDHTVEGGFAAMTSLLRQRRRPSAILASNDLTAIGAMRAARAAGLRVPEDLSVVGFDDIQLASYTEPPLTTVRLDRRDLARLAMDALAAMISPPAGGISGQEYAVSTELMVRHSTAELCRSKGVGADI